MKRQLLSLTAVLALVLVGCKKEDPKVEVTGVTLSKTTIEMVVGDSQSLTAAVAPSDATDKTISWSSGKESVATVDQSGKVTAVAPGTAVITAKSRNGKSASCTVTVSAKAVPVTGITLNKTELTLSEGEAATLTAAVTPETATNKTVSWSSSDDDVATVDQNGKVTAVSVGEATISAITADGGKKAECEVTVVAAEIHITAITFVPAELAIKDGETKQLTVAFTPEVYTDDDELEWASYDSSVLTVDQEGRITGVSVGSTKVQVRLKSNTSVTAFCNVTVEQDASLKGISLSSTIKEMQVGNTSQLTVMYTPEYAENKTVSWSSSNTAVATVDNTGNITAVAIGTATITVTSQEGNYTASCAVTVLEKAVDIYYVAGGELYKNGNQLCYFASNFRRLLFYEGNDYHISSNVIYKNGLEYYTIPKTITSDSWVTTQDMTIDPTTSNFYILHRSYPSEADFHRVSKLSPDKTLTEIEIETDVAYRHFENVVTANSGNIIIYGFENNAFNESIGYVWKITPSGTVTKTATGIPVNSYSDMASDNLGNFWIVDTDGKVYKNGILQYNLENRVLANYGRKIYCRNNDCYVMCENYSGSTNSVTVYKNGSLLNSFSFENVYGLYGFAVSSKDDIYMVVPFSDTKKRYIYMNNDVLFEVPNCTFVDIKE